MSNEIKGISHIYNEATGQSSVTWSYKDNPELKYFVLEYYDDIKQKWVPYDEHMGIVRKGDTATATPITTPITSDGGTSGGGGPQKYSTTIGGAKTVIVNHNLGSRDLIVSLRETASPYSQVYTAIEFTTINSLLVEFKETPAANEYTITIIG